MSADTELERLAERVAALEDAVRRARYGTAELDELERATRPSVELVTAHVPPGMRVAVVSDGDPLVLDLGERPTSQFPPGALAGHRIDDEPSAVAHLEAQRAAGTHYLLVPEPARGWLQRHPYFAEHLLGRYALVADEPGAGILVDVAQRRPADDETLADVLDDVAAGDRDAPVLDWTELDLGSRLGGRSVFKAPDGDDGVLPYLDETIDVVVVDDSTRLDEARRVARRAAVVVGSRGNGHLAAIEVDPARELRASSGAAPLVVVAADQDDEWLERVREAVADVPGAEVVASPDPWSEIARADAETAAVLEPGVLPLPECLAAAAGSLSSGGPTGAVAVKLLAADGGLEAAGAMVFADGSLRGIAADCAPAAPWHEFARPVCAGTGLLAVRPEAIRALDDPAGSFAGICAGLWAAGREVRYQPDAWAVRVHAPGRDATADEAETLRAWAPALPARPARPAALDAAAWRSLLAVEEPEAGWR